MKIDFFFLGGGGVRSGGGGCSGRGSQGGCEQRIEVFVKIQKKNGGVRGGGGGSGGGGVGLGGVRVDVIKELKFFGKFTKKIRGGMVWGVRVGGGGGQGGCQ